MEVLFIAACSFYSSTYDNLKVSLGAPIGLVDYIHSF